MNIIDTLAEIAGFSKPRKKKSKQAQLNSVSRRLTKKLKLKKMQKQIDNKRKQLNKA